MRNLSLLNTPVSAPLPGDQPKSGSETSVSTLVSKTPDVPAHILIADDPGRHGTNWAAALRRAGYRVALAADPDAAWHALDSDNYSLLLATHTAVGRTTLELIAKVRALDAQLPCVLISDPPTSSFPEMESFQSYGTVLEKPVAIPHLLHAVRVLLGRSVDASDLLAAPIAVGP